MAETSSMKNITTAPTSATREHPLLTAGRNIVCMYVIYLSSGTVGLKKDMMSM
jgi:hypothetical protein